MNSYIPVFKKITWVIFFILGLQFVLTDKIALQVVIRNINENYYYIYSEWVDKISRAKIENFKGKTIVFGTSVSVYGVHSSKKIVNLSLTAASAKQILNLMKIVSNGDHAIVELNPIAFSNRYLKTTNKFGLEKLFRAPNLTRLINTLPLLKYGHLYKKGINGILHVDGPELDTEIKKLRDQEFWQLYRGESDLEVFETNSNMAYRSCLALSTYSMKYGFDWRLLDEVIRQAKSRFSRVNFWVPHFNNKDLNLKASSFYSRIEKKLNGSFLSYKGSFEDYFDCQHLNSRGKKKLSMTLKKELL